jgi:hypothetical protein
MRNTIAIAVAASSLLAQAPMALAAPLSTNARPATVVGVAANRAALGLAEPSTSSDTAPCTPKNDGSGGCQGNEAGGKPNGGLPTTALIAVVLGGGAVAALAMGGHHHHGHPGSP